MHVCAWTLPVLIAAQVHTDKVWGEVVSIAGSELPKETVRVTIVVLPGV